MVEIPPPIRPFAFAGCGKEKREGGKVSHTPIGQPGPYTGVLGEH